MNLSFEFYGELIPLAGGERYTFRVAGMPATVAEALALLVDHCPALQPRLSRCAVVHDTEVLLRSDPLPDSGHLVLLPPVAGG
ncbi:MAG: MoaD/ThiS family protein [Pseudomonas sp.]